MKLKTEPHLSSMQMQYRDTCPALTKYASSVGYGLFSLQIEWCQDILATDDQVRIGSGLTTPSYEHLLQLKNLRIYTEAEAVQTTQKLLAPYKKKRQEEYLKIRHVEGSGWEEDELSRQNKCSSIEQSWHRARQRTWTKNDSRERGKDAKSKGIFARDQ